MAGDLMYRVSDGGIAKKPYYLAEEADRHQASPRTRARNHFDSPIAMAQSFSSALGSQSAGCARGSPSAVTTPRWRCFRARNLVFGNALGTYSRAGWNVGLSTHGTLRVFSQPGHITCRVPTMHCVCVLQVGHVTVCRGNCSPSEVSCPTTMKGDA
eukprot:1183267-Prorocentrum_minimum.AAC.6